MLLFCFVFCFLVFCFVLFCLFRATPMAYGGSQARVQSEQHLPAYTTATSYLSCARSLTHWTRPGIEPATSWFLVGFVNHCATTGTPYFFFLILFSNCMARGSNYPYMYTFFSPTLCSVATWVSRHGSQCYSAGSPCKISLWFWFAFPWWLEMLNIFLCAFCQSVCLW